MKLNAPLFAGAVIAGLVSLTAWAQPEPSHERLGEEKAFHKFTNIQIKNFQDESLGRIKDLSLDLTNGRIIGVLVDCDSSLDVGNKVVAVPPLALFPDLLNEVYRLNVSTEVFKSAPEIDLSNWESYGQSNRVAAYYRLFRQEPYFLEQGATASRTAKRPKVPFGVIERSSKILDMPVGNFQNVQFGKVWSLTMDIPKGRILNVVILAPGNFETKSIVPPMALSFNAKRDALLLDNTKAEFRDQPRYVFTAPAFGQDASYERESYQGPETAVALVQGYSYRDVDRTLLINKEIRAAKINGRNVEVGTMDGRVTLRGWVVSEDDKRRIGAIAIAASRLELVDNQIVVGKPVSNK